MAEVLQGPALQPALGMLGKVRRCFLLLSQIFENLWKEGEKEKKKKTEEGGERGDFVHAVAEVIGHRWGGSPPRRGGGQAGARGAASPAIPEAAVQSLPAQQHGHPAGGHGAGGHGNPFSTAASQKPCRMAGAHQRVAGVTGGGLQREGGPKACPMAGRAALTLCLA